MTESNGAFDGGKALSSTRRLNVCTSIVLVKFFVLVSTCIYLSNALRLALLCVTRLLAKSRAQVHQAK